MITECGEKNHVIIQKRIESAITEEFEKLLEENSNDTLLKLISTGKINELSLPELKEILSED